MGVEAIRASGGASRYRAGRGLRAAAVLFSVILVGCSPGAPATPPVTTAPVSPVTTPGPSPAASSQAAPGSTEGDVVITAITYSEDPASPFFAVVELGPNDAGISRLDVYRGADGRLSSVVAYGPEGLSSIIAFDPEGRPLRMDAGGYKAEFTYPASDVEVVITAPDGSVVRKRGPLDLGATVPAPAAPNAHLASFMEEPPAPGMVRWPIDFHSYSVVHLAVLRRGTNAGSIAEHVQFPKVLCTPAPFMGCAAEIVWAKDWGASETTPRLHVDSWVSSADPDPENPNPNPSWIWRTRADCDAYKPLLDRLVPGAGVAVYGIGAYRAVKAAATVVVAAPRLALGLVVVAGVIRAWQEWGPSSKPDCNSVPNLQKMQDAFLNHWALATATITVTASGDCRTSPQTGWLIKEPTTQTVTFEPFNPENRSPFGASADTDRTPLVGTIRFEAADCAVEMEGAFDLAATAAAAGMYPGAADVLAKMVTKNEILLELKKTDVQPSSPIDVTGTFALTFSSPDCCGFSLPNGCTSTQTTRGTLKGTIPQADDYHATGHATISVASSEYSCISPRAMKPTEFAWTALGNQATLKGKIEFSGELTGGPPVSWIFIVKEKP